MIQYPADTKLFAALKPDYSPQADRNRFLANAATFALLCLLMFYLSVFVPMLEPKFGLALAGISLVLSGRRSLGNCVPFILGIIGYGVAVALIFPAPKPNIGLILQRSLFYTDCVLIGVACLSGESLGKHYFLLFGILLISAAGMAGDLMGHDMTALLPFEMPNEAYFDQVTMDTAGSARIRGFFAESGVLGAISIGITTCTALGATVLIVARVKTRAALTVVFSSLVLGGAILCLTVTKSGIVMMMAGMTGFLLRLLFSRDGWCRTASIGAMVMGMICAVVFALAAPGDVTSYLKEEVASTANLRGENTSSFAGHEGMATRIQCWKAAIYTLRYYPCGVGPWGLGSVLDKTTGVRQTHEMQFFFSQDVYGLKNALADLMAETGMVGLGLLAFWLWRGFWVPARIHYSFGSRTGILIAGMYWATACLSLALLISCELYPCLAMLVIFKFHADAIADACAPDNEQATQPATES